MIPYLNRLSSFLFYLLGGTFFLAYMVHYNELSPLGGWWLRVADLPLALIGMIYGGTSLYLSVKPRERDSKVLFAIIGIPLIAAFATFVVMNFWPVLTA